MEKLKGGKRKVQSDNTLYDIVFKYLCNSTFKKALEYERLYRKYNKIIYCLNDEIKTLRIWNKKKKLKLEQRKTKIKELAEHFYMLYFNECRFLEKLIDYQNN